MARNIIVTGLGGQGVVFLTRLLAQTAVTLGHEVLVSETHGMSQRGGSVISHLKIGGDMAPLIRQGKADLLLALEASEAVRNLPYLRPGGTAIINSDNGLPPELDEHLQRLNIQIHSLPASQKAMALGSPAMTNVLLAGFAAAHPVLALPIETLRTTLEEIVPRGRELNLKALQTGYAAGVELPQP